MKDLYSVSVVIVVLLVDKLVVVIVLVPSVDCKIVGLAVIIIIRKAVVIGKPTLLVIQYCCLVLRSSCHDLLLVTITLSNPVFAKTSFHRSNSNA